MYSPMMKKSWRIEGEGCYHGGDLLSIQWNPCRVARIMSWWETNVRVGTSSCFLLTAAWAIGGCHRTDPKDLDDDRTDPKDIDDAPPSEEVADIVTDSLLSLERYTTWQVSEDCIYQWQIFVYLRYSDKSEYLTLRLWSWACDLCYGVEWERVWRDE